MSVKHQNIILVVTLLKTELVMNLFAKLSLHNFSVVNVGGDERNRAVTVTAGLCP